VQRVIEVFHTELRKAYQILDNDELQEIHSATLDVLENVGVKFEDEAVLRLLGGVGASVDFRTHVARLPSSLVEEAIEKCPRRVTLCGRTKDHDLTLGGGKVYFTAGANALHIL
jgi:trimethylamine--corrinoid protein Co-methyltransferase